MARDSVRGDAELATALRLLSRGPTARQVDGMANRSMKPMLDDVRGRLKAIRNYPSKYSTFFPKQRGKMSEHVDRDILMRKDDQQDLGKRSYRIGATRRARFLLHLIEYGTAAHVQPHLNGGFMHPGASPHPTITPAYEAGHAGVVSAFGTEIAQWLQTDAASLGLRVRR